MALLRKMKEEKIQVIFQHSAIQSGTDFGLKSPTTMMTMNACFNMTDYFIFWDYKIDFKQSQYAEKAFKHRTWKDEGF